VPSEVTHMMNNRPLILTILDGWGYCPASPGNAIALANKPNYDRLLREFPNTLVHTSGPNVGLPEGQMGNSEVGHLNIGAGRILLQDLPRISDAVADGSIETSPALQGLIEKLHETGGTCHLIGLVSPGGVHSHQDHAAELAHI